MGAHNGADPAERCRPAASARARVPEHVVYRSFPQETVLLNLTTGTYHGLNATAGRMLEALERAPSIAAAAAQVAVEFSQQPALVERDLCELCGALKARGLLQVDEEAEP
jgi:pantoate kinase